MLINVDTPEFNTILAALRFYQEKGQGDPANRSDAIHEIATEDSLNDQGIDELCERINTQPGSPYLIATLSGGIVQGFDTNMSAFEHVDLIVLDMDTKDGSVDVTEHGVAVHPGETAEVCKTKIAESYGQEIVT